MTRFLLPLLFSLLPVTASAKCVGQNLFQALPEPDRTALTMARDAQPFAAGNFWTAVRGDQTITLIGTFHLTDDRHAPVVSALEPLLDQASALLVEAGPEEEAALKSMLARDPALMVITDGPSLADQLAPDEWAALKPAMAARGVPGPMAAKMKPWFVAASLGLPVCAMAQASAHDGLDQRLITAATARGLKIAALEPPETLLKVFGQMSQAEQLDMIRSALALEHLGDDMITTMSDLYFQGDARMIWEFSKHQALSLPGYTPERVEAEFAVTEEALMNSRNRAWIARIEAAATEGPAVIAFGALHLSGQEGVLNLLAQRGWQITPLALGGLAP
jgi:uncharacterized protein YbaP (TraB family)